MDFRSALAQGRKAQEYKKSSAAMKIKPIAELILQRHLELDKRSELIVDE